MASQLFRNLDRLAGTAGNVLYGENARQDQLMQAHLGRRQEMYMQGQKQTEARKLQQMRLDSSQSLLNQRMGEAARQFDIRERRLSLERQDDLAYNKDRLFQMGQKNLYDRDKAKEDNIKDQLKGYDDTEDNLIQEGRMITAQYKHPTLGVTEEGKDLLFQISQKLKDVRAKKEIYANEFLPLYIKQKMEVADKELEQARIKELAEYDKYNPLRYGPYFNTISDTTYKTNNTATDADKSRYTNDNDPLGLR